MKWFFRFCGALSLTDAAIAISEFDHLGDMHIAWAGNSLIAAGVFIVWAQRAAVSSGTRDA